MQDQAPSLTPGTTFEGRYQISEKLGEGGFGSVHKARQLTTGQAVALKVMHLAAPADEARREKRVARFLREMQLCGQLHHPNLVQLVDSGRAEGGQLYTVFAFAPGHNLADLLAGEGALSPREAKHLMLQVLDGLACVHAAGVVHRDLKPSNIMVVPTGARRNALVLDFGVGAIVDEDEARDLTRLTATNDALGTPGYAAPEQWRGLGPTPRADLFAWGLVFLECLTGRPVYTGTAAEMVYQVLGPDPVPIPPEIERHPLGEILRAAIRKDPSARDVSARALFDALDACDVWALSPAARAAMAIAAGTTETIVRRLAAPGGERRQVTAMVCTLGVEPAAEGRAPARDALDEALRAGIALAAEVARGHHGHVAAALGDALLVYFGYPHAEEDDAHRAARTALAITRAIEAENEQLAALGLRLGTKIGVHTGLLDTQGPSDLVLAAGGTPRLAARLSALAPPDGVLCTADTQRLIRGAFALEAEGKPRVDGADGAVKIFRLDRGEHVPGATPEASRTPLVGRQQEVDLLLDRWRRARAGGGQCALVTGEPGIGKSRLARELRDRLANDPHTFLEGRCSPDTRNSALYPVVDLLGRALRLDREGSPEGKTAELDAQLVRHGLAPAEAMPLFLPLFSLPVGAPYAPLDVSPQKQKDLTLEAIVSLLATMAEEQPLLLLAEDLHWADPTTLELLGRLVREAPSTSMCLLLTARPEFIPAFSTTGMLQLQLNRLDRAQIEALAGDVAGGKALPPAVLEQVASRTDGIPLFVEELTRMMVESGALVEHADRYEVAGALSEAEIPSTLRALLAARLDRLGRAKETAQIAAALGREFGLDVLAAVSPGGATTVQEDLDRLAGAGLVLRKRRVKDPGGVFKHALVRDAAYESLPMEARRRVHARIAAALEERFQGVVEARPEVLAHHHAAAEQKQTAIGYAQKAAQRAFERSTYVEAVRQAHEAVGWLHALPATAERDQTELSLYSLMLIVMLTDGTPGPVAPAQVAQRTLELVERHGDDEAAVPVLWRLLLYYLRVRVDAAEKIASRLLPLVARTGDVGQEVAARSLVGVCRCLEGRLGEARADMEHVLSRYDPEAHGKSARVYGMDPKVTAHTVLARLMSLMGYHEQALDHARAALAWSETLHHPVSTSNALLFLATAHYYRSDRQGVAEVAAQMVSGARLYGQMMSVLGSLLQAWAAGDPGAARRALETVRARRDKSGMTQWLAVVAETESAAGEHARALEHVAEALALAEETGEAYVASELGRLQAMSLKALGEADDAGVEARLREAVDTARRQGAWTLALRAGLPLARLLCDRGAPGAARSLLQPLYEAFDEGRDLPDMAAARNLLEQIDSTARR